MLTDASACGVWSKRWQTKTAKAKMATECQVKMATDYNGKSQNGDTDAVLLSGSERWVPI